jgi:ribonucleotide monophosphatase NagD (HAD superfamily)
MAVERMRSAAPRAGAGQRLAPSSTAVLGDRLETDILGGQRAGLRTILVTTGVDDEHTVVQKGIEPDLVVSGLDVLVDLWQVQSKKVNDEEVVDEGP